VQKPDGDPQQSNHGDGWPDRLHHLPAQGVAAGVRGRRVSYSQHDRGGHFAAWEQPQLLSEDVRATFRSLR
jgi:hypothetical protein